MNENKQLVLYGLLLLALLLLAWSALGFLSMNAQPASGGQLQNTQENYAQFVADEASDKCQTPAGYTDEQWREHMGHHPDRYSECL